MIIFDCELRDTESKAYEIMFAIFTLKDNSHMFQYNIASRIKTTLTTQTELVHWIH